MIKALSRLSVMAAIAAAPWAIPAKAETKSIADWYMACDNLRSCSAYGLTSTGDPAFLRLERDGDAGAAPAWVDRLEPRRHAGRHPDRPRFR